MRLSQEQLRALVGRHKLKDMRPGSKVWARPGAAPEPSQVPHCWVACTEIVVEEPAKASSKSISKL